MHEILANFVVMAQRYALGALKSVHGEGNEDEESSRSVKMILRKVVGYVEFGRLCEVLPRFFRRIQATTTQPN